ncbi:MAG: hypothetical protein IJD39_07010 [Clostridia bacterium]|nr:hypothetical protein [Clostridia bacterium]
MKKMIFICCLLVLFFAVLGLKTVVDQEKISMNDERILSQSTASDQDIENVNSAREAAAQDQSTSENTNDSYLVNLEVDGGYLSLRIPNGYQLQEYQLSDLEKYPDNYAFFNEVARAKFVVRSSLKDEKNQSIWLRKLYDKGNKFIVFDDVLIGEHSYIVYTNEQATFDYGFLVQAGNGYSYQFFYQLPYDTIQNEIPAEAISILSTLEIQEFQAKTNDSYLVNLEVDGGYLCLCIPNGYQLQEYQLSDLEKYPDNYVFFNEAAQAKFIVYSKLDDEKNQSIGLGKLYDKSNKFIIFDDVLIGEYSYIVHTKEQATFDYGFHVREGNGYSYYFQHIVPYDTIQNEIPEEAISILSTLQIQGAIPGDTDIPDGEIG